MTETLASQRKAALLHVAVADAEVRRGCARSALRYAPASSARAEVGLADDLEQRHAGAVEVDPRLSRPPRTSWMFLPASSSMWMRVMPDVPLLAVRPRRSSAPPRADRQLVLRDLVALGQVRVEVVLAGEDGSSPRSCAAEGQAGADRRTRPTCALSTGSAPGMPRQTGQTWRVRRARRRRRSSRRRSCVVVSELGVDLEADDDLVVGSPAWSAPPATDGAGSGRRSRPGRPDRLGA